MDPATIGLAMTPSAFSRAVFDTVREVNPALFSVTSGLPTRLIGRPSSCLRRSGTSRATISTSPFSFASDSE